MHSRNITDYTSRSSAQHLSSTSRPLATPANKLIRSSNPSHRTQPRFVLDFRSPNGPANVQKWYESQACTRFTLLEYRKYKYGPAKHEFITVQLGETTLCRFDRRAREGGRGYSLLDEGTPAEDSAHVLSSFEPEYEDLMQETELLLSIKLPRGEDLNFILAVCEGIQNHAKAATYSLMRYNCYFFSWTIVAAVARRTYNWETIILSKSGWNNILQTSITRALEFSAPNQRTGELGSMRLRFRRVVSKLYVRSQNYIQLTTPSPENKAFQDALFSTYSNSHDTIQKIPRKLLFRSQLGPALNRELRCIESSSMLSAKLTATTDIGSSEEIWMWQYFSPWQWWSVAPEGLEEETPSLDDIRDKMMKAWKKAWDEINKLSAQYIAIITETITTTMTEQLVDVAPDQLVFGDIIQRCSGSHLTNGHTSLQDFIRGRMQGHFEVVDKFGFGSFQELITTAEVAMCEIWVASLGIMDSGHSRRQRVRITHSTA
ncbi:unnamed protein product [Rhizoctonia solani]|uniref:PPPDE domain-containing protein n=1 Tax=Rhizoctonia solani TaxID=456999 RepID=A0A8H3GP21_9AGAM|nr:unnamed protein product [Rhizoctonia solani]